MHTRRPVAAASTTDWGEPILRSSLSRGAGLALSAAGRTVGWTAHALEQRGEGRLIRTRAEHPSASTGEAN